VSHVRSFVFHKTFRSSLSPGTASVPGTGHASLLDADSDILPLLISAEIAAGTSNSSKRRRQK